MELYNSEGFMFLYYKTSNTTTGSSTWTRAIDTYCSPWLIMDGMHMSDLKNAPKLRSKNPYLGWYKNTKLCNDLDKTAPHIEIIRDILIIFCAEV